MEKDNYKKAYKEVYVILEELVEEDYKKIPQDVIDVITQNKDDDYEFKLDFSIELKDNDLLPETRAILFNLFRDYLSTPVQKEKIIKWQNEERKKEENSKKENYKGDIFYNNSTKSTEEVKTEEFENNNLMEIKPNLFKKIFNYLKSLFKKKIN